MLSLHELLKQNCSSSRGMSRKKQRRAARKSAAFELGAKLAIELTTAGRKRIKAKNFAIPSRAKTPEGKAESGSYPIPDRAHAQNALARVSQHGTSSEKAQVRSKVHAKYPNMGKESGLSGSLSPDFNRALRPGYVSGSGVGGALLGGGLGTMLGLVEQKEDKESRLAHILKRLLQGGAIGGLAGGAYGLGRLHGP